MTMSTENGLPWGTRIELAVAWFRDRHLPHPRRLCISRSCLASLRAEAERNTGRKWLGVGVNTTAGKLSLRVFPSERYVAWIESEDGTVVCPLRRTTNEVFDPPRARGLLPKVFVGPDDSWPGFD